jgi:hypothetical protein
MVMSSATYSGSLEDFRTAVRYLLVNEHGISGLVADQVLEADAQHVRDAYNERRESALATVEVADELAIKLHQRTAMSQDDLNNIWVRICAGEYAAAAGHSLEPQPRKVVDDEVAQVMSIPTDSMEKLSMYARRPSGLWTSF